MDERHFEHTLVQTLATVFIFLFCLLMFFKFLLD